MYDVIQLKVPLNEVVEVGDGDGAMYAGDIGIIISIMRKTFSRANKAIVHT